MFDFALFIHQLKQQSYSRYLWLMLAPTAARQPMLALMALDTELAQIPSKVSEEMLGQIRYTWWQESIDLLETGQVRQHPVVELWASFDFTHPPSSPQAVGIRSATTLISLHREHFEQHMDLGAKMDTAHALNISRDYMAEACAEIIQTQAPKQLATWQRKLAIIQRYQEKGTCRPGNIYMIIKLLFF